MLLSQFSPSMQREITSELGIDLKVVNGKIGRTSITGNDRIARLQAVCRYLEKKHYVGSVDGPGSYFQGSLSIQWGPYGESLESPVVYFGGSTEKTIVGLGGATSNLIGQVTASDTSIFSHSATPALMHALGISQTAASLATAVGIARDDGDRAGLMAVHLANRSLSGPNQNMEFMAKRLLGGPSPYPQRDPHPGMNVLLGSPLYVAMVD